MTPSPSCPRSDLWQELLKGSLPESEQAGLADHLETCTDCQQTLEGLAGGSVEWSGPARQLGRADGAPEAALLRVMDELKGTDNKGERSPPAGGGKDLSLPFLQPSGKPGYRGRLGHYEIHGIIGRGGMGVVLKAFDTALLRTVAVKVLAPHLAASAGARQRFIREAQAAAQVSHDHVVAIHAVDASGDLPYLVMQYIPGTSLQECLDRGAGLEPEEVARIGMQTAAGLAAAHARGLIHRDIKPANILLQTEEAEWRTEGPDPSCPSSSLGKVKITDFGLAQTLDAPDLTQSGVVAGTPMYMAPEQARGEALDHRADLFSLGSVLYALCTGQAAFPAGSILATLQSVCTDTPRPIREISPRVPVWLVRVIEKLHAKDPAERFQSAAEVAQVLGDYSSRRRAPTPAAAPSLQRATAEHPARVRKRTWPWALVGGTLLGLVFLAGLGVAGFIGLWGNDSDTPPPQTENHKSQPDAGPASLRYGWKKGEKYIYWVQFTADRGDGLEAAQGSCSYQVGSAGPEGYSLTYTGMFFATRNSPHGVPVPAGFLTPTLFGRFAGIGLPGMFHQGKITIDPVGNCQGAGGQDHLPVVLGNLAQLVIEPLSPEGKKTWKARSFRTLSEMNTGFGGMPFEIPKIRPAPLPLPHPPVGLRGQERMTGLAAEEHAVYTVESATANTAVIRKEYELATQDRVNQIPRVEIRGEGRITFDLNKGVPRALQFKATLTESTGRGTQRTPLTLNYKLLEGEELKKFLNPPPQPKIERKPLSAEELTRALNDLRSDEPARRREAAQRLEQAKPKARRSEAADALAALLGDKDGATRYAAARALAVWAVRATVPALIRMLADQDYFIRQAALDALERLKDPRAAQAVARRLPELSDRGKATKVLQAMGPAAAEAVARYLPHEDLWTRYEACKILKTIGTKAQVPALQQAGKDQNPLVAGAAKEAIQAIAQRKK
jgi:serine/threonine-protein kinase